MPLLLSYFFSTFLLLAGAHIVAIKFFLYWRFFWFDIPMHLLGGIVIVLGIAILPFLGIQFFARNNSLTAILVAVLSIGIAWELFEFVAGISVFDETLFLDTGTDLIMDIVGGLLGYGIVRSHKYNM